MRRLVSPIPYNETKFIVGNIYKVQYIASENLYVIQGENGILHLNKQEIDIYFSREIQ